MLIIPFISPFFFFSNKFFNTDFSAPMRATVFKFCILLQRVEVYYVKENHDAEIYFAFFLPFFPTMWQFPELFLMFLPVTRHR